MPGTTKKSMSPKPNKAKPRQTIETPDTKSGLKCMRCGGVYNTQKKNFPLSQSLMFASNNYYMPWCYRCVNQLYVFYKETCGLSDRDAIRRVCSKTDIYWLDQIYEKVEMSPANTPNRMSDYIHMSNRCFGAYLGKTFDDTLAEEAAAALEAQEKARAEEQARIQAAALQLAGDMIKQVPQEVTPPEQWIDFWGGDLSYAEYAALQKRYDKWVETGKYDENDPAVQTLLKQICVTEYDIERGRVDGKAVDKLQSTLNNYLGSLNAKPSQQRETVSTLDSMSFGVGIQKWEMTRPVPQPKEEWKDVDGIVKYITTWFIGHLCHMLKIDNKYNQMYQEQVNKYTVNRPQEEYDQDVEDVFNDLFGGDENDQDGYN